MRSGARDEAATPVPVLSASATIHAPADRIYHIIADYREGHPAILPRPPFVSLDIEEGGTGEGTVIRVEMEVLGRTRVFRAAVTEPEPGRTLVETNDTGYVTTFAVDPVGERTRVTLSTVDSRGRGIMRAVKRRLTARLLRPVYARELELLAEAARR
jgi:hypothetical protein